MTMAKKGEKLASLRHSLAHLLAASVKELYPGSHNAIGPAIENGFYQDFEMSQAISEKELPKIEKRMREKLKEWSDPERMTATSDEAREVFKDNPYKISLIDDFAKERKEITIYTTNGFVDLCKGGHSDLRKIKPESFKLDRVAGAYWKGDEKNKMLTRIYGLAFESKKELDKHLAMRKEAEKRDHRKIGKELDLFTFSELVGAGLPLFTPKGTLIRNLLAQKVADLRKKFGYTPVWIPHIAKKELYITSGHWDKFGDELFKVSGSAGTTEFVLKPMNCPHHNEIYARKLHSYRELPVRYSETTSNRLTLWLSS